MFLFDGDVGKNRRRNGRMWHLLLAEYNKKKSGQRCETPFSKSGASAQNRPAICVRKCRAITSPSPLYILLFLIIIISLRRCRACSTWWHLLRLHHPLPRRTGYSFEIRLYYLTCLSVCLVCRQPHPVVLFVCFLGSRRTRQSAMEGVDPGSAIRRDWRSTCWSIIYKLTDRNNKPMTGESCYSAQHQLSIVYSNAQSAQWPQKGGRRENEKISIDENVDSIPFFRSAYYNQRDWERDVNLLMAN